MNKHWYSYGNFFKVKFRDHYCDKCGTKLSIATHRRIVSQKSEEAKYYDFEAGVDGGIMVGSCEFIHKVFHCSKCSKNIEFITQINLEDIDILIKKVEDYFNEKGKKISITKFFETRDDLIVNQFDSVENTENLCLSIAEIGKETVVYKTPLRRKERWERPYYFNVSKKQLIKFIQR